MPWTTGMAPDVRRLRALEAALAFLQLPVNAPELQMLHGWLDNWTGIGLIVTGMTRHGFQLGLDQRTGYWLALFYTGTGGHRQVTVAGTSQASTPWAAVQRAAWAAVKWGTHDDAAR